MDDSLKRLEFDITRIAQPTRLEECLENLEFI